MTRPPRERITAEKTVDQKVNCPKGQEKPPWGAGRPYGMVHPLASSLRGQEGHRSLRQELRYHLGKAGPQRFQILRSVAEMAGMLQDRITDGRVILQIPAGPQGYQLVPAGLEGQGGNCQTRQNPTDPADLRQKLQKKEKGDNSREE